MLIINIYVILRPKDNLVQPFANNVCDILNILNNAQAVHPSMRVGAMCVQDPY